MSAAPSCEFGQVRLSPAQAQARVGLVRDLVKFVEQGLRDSVGRLRVELAPWSTQVLERYLEPLGARMPSDLDDEQARQDAARAFEASFLSAAQANRLKVPLPTLYGWQWASPAQSASQTGNSTTAEGSVQAAFDMSRDNAMRARQRVVTLLCVNDHLLSFRGPVGRVSAAQQAFDAAFAHFWEQVRRFEADCWRFAIVLGGDMLEQVRQEIRDHLLDSTYSVVPYLTQDGLIPSRWGAELESNFHADVRRLAAPA